MNKKTKPAVTLPARVEKIVPQNRYEPEKAEISVDGADPLYREIRLENKLQDEQGKDVELKPDAEAEVTIEAESDNTTPKNKSSNGEPKKTETEYRP